MDAEYIIRTTVNAVRSATGHIIANNVENSVVRQVTATLKQVEENKKHMIKEEPKIVEPVVQPVPVKKEEKKSKGWGRKTKVDDKEKSYNEVVDDHYGDKDD